MAFLLNLLHRCQGEWEWESPGPSLDFSSRPIIRIFVLSSCTRAERAQKSEKFDLIYRKSFAAWYPSIYSLLQLDSGSRILPKVQTASAGDKNPEETEIYFGFFGGKKTYKKFRAYFAIWETERQKLGREKPQEEGLYTEIIFTN